MITIINMFMFMDLDMDWGRDRVRGTDRGRDTDIHSVSDPLNVKNASKFLSQLGGLSDPSRQISVGVDPSDLISAESQIPPNFFPQGLTPLSKISAE
jgi:hypothetical protein